MPDKKWNAQTQEKITAELTRIRESYMLELQKHGATVAEANQLRIECNELRKEIAKLKQEPEDLRLGIIGWGGHIAVLTEEVREFQNRENKLRALCTKHAGTVNSESILAILDEDSEDEE